MLNYALWLLLGFFLKNCVLSLTWTKVVKNYHCSFPKVILYFFSEKKLRFLISISMKKRLRIWGKITPEHFHPRHTKSFLNFLNYMTYKIFLKFQFEIFQNDTFSTELENCRIAELS